MQLTGHINEGQVMALYLGNLSQEERQRLHRHVSDCSGCSREFELYREILDGVETLVTEIGDEKRADGIRALIKNKMRTKQIYYDLMYHPITGPMWMAATERGICMLQFSEQTPFEIEEALEEKQPDAWIIRDQSAMSAITLELRAYLEQELFEFSFPIDWRFVPTGFRRQVLEKTAKIPYGQVHTYGEVAESIGNPKSVRAIGQALRANPIPIVIPCHRVVARGGKLGGFSGGLNLKRRLLELEGVSWPNGTKQMDLFTRLRK